MRQFKQRLFMSGLSICVISLCVYYSYSPWFKFIFTLLNAGIISVALLEYYQLAKHKGLHPLSSIGVGCSILYVIAFSLSLHHPQLSALPYLILFVTLLLVFLSFFRSSFPPLENLAVTFFGIIYLTVPLSFIVGINDFFPSLKQGDGRLWLAYALLTTKATDVGGYLVGKLVGKTPLTPLISPKKTVEGALGGLALSLAVSFLFALSFSTPLEHPFFKLSLSQSLWLGLLLSLLAQIGDLAESLLKRDAGVKDSSRLPGLGGILDVVDSLVFTLPLMYLLLKIEWVGY